MSRSDRFVAFLPLDSFQDLPDPGPVEANLASDGPIAHAFGAEGKDGLAKLGLIGIWEIVRR